MSSGGSGAPSAIGSIGVFHIRFLYISFQKCVLCFRSHDSWAQPGLSYLSFAFPSFNHEYRQGRDETRPIEETGNALA